MITRMKQLPKNLYTSKQTRELDRITAEEFDVSGTVLMERAGEVAFIILKQHWPDAKTLCLVCGTGNNGGDGFVARCVQACYKTSEVQSDCVCDIVTRLTTLKRGLQ